MTLDPNGRGTAQPAVSPASRRAVIQRGLLGLVLCSGSVAVTLGVTRRVVPALAAALVTVAVALLLLVGAQRKSGPLGRWSIHLPRPTVVWVHRGDPGRPQPAHHGRRGGGPGKSAEPPTLCEAGGPGYVQVMNPVPDPVSAGRSARGARARRNEPEPPAAVGVADRVHQLPDPPVFSGVSAPGQAPWFLPVGSAPNGLAADAARLGDLDVRAASIVGAGHRCQEPAGPRQDAYALARTPGGEFLVVAVADGVSQSKRSDLGARVAVTAATRELVNMLVSGGPRAIDVDLLYKRIAGEMLGTGRSRGLPDEDICSILIAAVIPASPRADGTRPIWASWIGDVSLWLLRGGALRRMTGAEKTGLDRNMLDAVLPFNPGRAEHGEFELDPSDRIAVVTDGLSDSLSSLSGALEYFTQEWANPAPHPAAFLHSLCYDGPGQTDDRTAVVVWCSASGSPRPAGRPGRAG
jgi:hypothetical protein